MLNRLQAKDSTEHLKQQEFMWSLQWKHSSPLPWQNQYLISPCWITIVCQMPKKNWFLFCRSVLYFLTGLSSSLFFPTCLFLAPKLFCYVSLVVRPHCSVFLSAMFVSFLLFGYGLYSFQLFGHLSVLMFCIFVSCFLFCFVLCSSVSYILLICSSIMYIPPYRTALVNVRVYSVFCSYQCYGLI